MNIYPDRQTELPKTVDEIRFYGLSAQRKLEQISKTLSGAVLQCTPAVIENRIALSITHVCELDPEAQPKKNERNPVVSAIFSKKTKWEQYGSLYHEIDDLKLSLQMQQVQFLKEIDILNRLQNEADSCCDELREIIESGSRFLKGTISGPLEDDETTQFRDRLNQRITDLRLSETIALQSKAQIILLKNNANELSEKLQNTVTNVIPLWRNQVSLILGIGTIGNDSKKPFSRSGISNKPDSMLISSVKHADRQLLEALSDIDSLLRKAQGANRGSN